jgi:hypothetical protein
MAGLMLLVVGGFIASMTVALPCVSLYSFTGLSLLICATYGSIQSVRKPDTAYIQCPPEDERSDARNM